MNFLRKHWYDLGGLFAVIVVAYLFLQYPHLTDYQLLMWLHLVSLFLHQSEEYRLAGTFPGMINTVMYHSATPDRYPLNTNTAFCINVMAGWGVYLLAAICAENAVWLGIAAILVSAGNVIAHSFIFNIKGKTIYNAGLIICWLAFIPCIYFFFSIIYRSHLVTVADYCIGIPAGVIINIIGIVKMIDWMADKNTKYVFAKRNLLPADRQQTAGN